MQIFQPWLTKLLPLLKFSIKFQEFCFLWHFSLLSGDQLMSYHESTVGLLCLGYRNLPNHQMEAKILTSSSEGLDFCSWGLEGLVSCQSLTACGLKGLLYRGGPGAHSSLSLPPILFCCFHITIILSLEKVSPCCEQTLVDQRTARQLSLSSDK